MPEKRHLGTLPGSGEAVFSHLGLERDWLQLEVIIDVLFGFNVLCLYRSVNRGRVRNFLICPSSVLLIGCQACAVNLVTAPV